MKKYIPVILSLIIMVVFCCSVVFLTQADLGTVIPTVTPKLEMPVIIIDPGHGGFDGGAVSVNGKNEKDYNLEIATKLATLLQAEGFSVVMTRVEDCGTEDDGLGTIREKKVSDIKNRMELMNSYDQCVFISIHQNYFSDASCHGAQVFYSPNTEESKSLAMAIQKNIAALVEPDNTRTVKKADKSIYLLNNAQRPAVLIECGFISNYENMLKLEDETFQKQFVFAVSDAIYHHLYLSEEYYGT